MPQGERSGYVRRDNPANASAFGRLAHMVERSLSMREARGSIPRLSSLASQHAPLQLFFAGDDSSVYACLTGKACPKPRTTLPFWFRKLLFPLALQKKEAASCMMWQQNKQVRGQKEDIRPASVVCAVAGRRAFYTLCGARTCDHVALYQLT